MSKPSRRFFQVYVAFSELLRNETKFFINKIKSPHENMGKNL